MGSRLRFVDGSFAEVGAVICCTGYARRLPFLSDALLENKQNSIELYKHVFHPDIPTLAFIGLCNVAGSTFRLSRFKGAGSLGCWQVVYIFLQERRCTLP